MKKITKDIAVEPLIAKQMTSWEVRQKLHRRLLEERAALNPWEKAYLTISRDIGSRGTEIAYEVAQQLHWQVFDRELVEYIATTARVRQSVIESFDEKKQSEIQTWLQTILSHQALGTDKYLKHLLSVLLTIAEHGQSIIIGRGGNFVLASKYGLRVKITAPLEQRIQTIMGEKKIPAKEARHFITKMDSQRLAFIRHYFHRDADDPQAYDLVLNTAELTVPTTAAILIGALESKLGVPRPALPVSGTAG